MFYKFTRSSRWINTCTVQFWIASTKWYICLEPTLALSINLSYGMKNMVPGESIGGATWFFPLAFEFNTTTSIRMLTSCYSVISSSFVLPFLFGVLASSSFNILYFFGLIVRCRPILGFYIYISH